MVAAAVIIHLAADGTIYSDQTQSNITVQLVDTKEQLHNLGLSGFLNHAFTLIVLFTSHH